MAFETDFKVIATAGPTVDGRDIPDEDLEQIAQSYDPEEYTAVIWGSDPFGHSRWYGNFGTVKEVKLGKDKKGRTTLLGKYSVNKKFIEQHDMGQRLFSSIEYYPNFAGTGKPYLTGVALTDEPASIGTQAMREFSKNKSGLVFSAPADGVDFSLKELIQQSTAAQDLAGMDNAGTDASGTDADLNLFKRFMSLLKGADNLEQSNPAEDTDMTEQQFQALLAAQDKTYELLANHFSQGSGDAGSNGNEANDAAGANGAADNAADNEQTTATVSAEQFNQLLEGQTKMTEMFSQLLGEKAGTDAGDNDGNAENQGIVG